MVKGAARLTASVLEIWFAVREIAQNRLTFANGTLMDAAAARSQLTQNAIQQLGTSSLLNAAPMTTPVTMVKVAARTMTSVLEIWFVVRAIAQNRLTFANGTLMAVAAARNQPTQNAIQQLGINSLLTAALRISHAMKVKANAKMMSSALEIWCAARTTALQRLISANGMLMAVAAARNPSKTTKYYCCGHHILVSLTCRLQ